MVWTYNVINAFAVGLWNRQINDNFWYSKQYFFTPCPPSKALLNIAWLARLLTIIRLLISLMHDLHHLCQKSFLRIWNKGSINILRNNVWSIQGCFPVQKNYDCIFTSFYIIIYSIFTFVIIATRNFFFK